MKKCTLVLAILLTGLLFADLSAKNGELVLKDGRTLVEGDITEKPDGYEVVEPGNMTPRIVTKDQVIGQPVYYDTPAEGYDKKKAAIGKDDKDYVKKMLALATWAMKHKLNDQMGDAAAAVLAADSTIVRAKLMLDASKTRTSQPATETIVKPGPGPGPGPGPKPTPIISMGPTGKLSDKDVNTIRLLEMAPNDRVPMNFKRTDLWQLVLELAKDKTDADLNGVRAQDNFLALKPDPFAQMRFAMAKINPDSYFRLAEKVTVRNDPVCLSGFKTTINPWLVSTCGSASCHGGNAAAPFRFQNGKDDAAVYTNFYVVSEFVGKTGRLLDRDRPEESLILKFGLNPDLVDGKEQHPPINTLAVRLGSPAFRDRNARIYQLVKAWLAPTMGDDRKPECLRTNDRVEYHITFPANGVAATQRDMPAGPMPVAPPVNTGRPGVGGPPGPGGAFQPAIPTRPGPGVPNQNGPFQPVAPGKNGPG